MNFDWCHWLNFLSFCYCGNVEWIDLVEKLWREFWSGLSNHQVTKRLIHPERYLTPAAKTNNSSRIAQWREKIELQSKTAQTSIEFFLNDFRWIQWIVTKSKIGMALVIVIFSDEVVKMKIYYYDDWIGIYSVWLVAIDTYLEVIKKIYFLLTITGNVTMYKRYC